MVNRPDIILKNKKEKTCILIDDGDTSAQEYHAKRRTQENKYGSLCIQIQRKWIMKFMLISIIITATAKVTSYKEKFRSHVR